MRKLTPKKIFKTIFILISFIITYIICIAIANNFIVTPLINYLSDSEIARIFVSCILGWFGLSTIFNILVEGKSK